MTSFLNTFWNSHDDDDIRGGVVVRGKRGMGEKGEGGGSSGGREGRDWRRLRLRRTCMERSMNRKKKKKKALKLRHWLQKCQIYRHWKCGIVAISCHKWLQQNSNRDLTFKVWSLEYEERGLEKSRREREREKKNALTLFFFSFFFFFLFFFLIFYFLHITVHPFFAS